jgi:hypothetical protein
MIDSETKEREPPHSLVCFSGVYYALGGIGIGLGFLATSQFLKVYTYIKKPLWLTPIYSEWVGAWWLVYALGTCISLVLCLLLCLFDVGRRRKYLDSQKEFPASSLNPTYQLLTPSNVNPSDSIQNSRLISSRTSSSTTNLSSTVNTLPNEIISHSHDGQLLATSSPPPATDVTEEKVSMSTDLLKFYEFVYDIFSLIKHLLLNLRFMGITCCAIVEALLIKGYLAFLSKHIEYQFRTTSSHSSVYIGVISLFSVSSFSLCASQRHRSSIQVIFGAPLGAFCVKRFDMNGRQCAKFCCIILATSSVIFLGLILHCREPTIGTFAEPSPHSSTDAPLLVQVRHIPCPSSRLPSTMISSMNL